MIISPISDITANESEEEEEGKQAHGKASERERKKKASGKERRLGKRGRIKWQGLSEGEENDRQMANNVNAREMSL